MKIIKKGIEMEKEIKEKLVIALDVNEIEDAKRIIEELNEYVKTFKVGLQLYTRYGKEIIKYMNENSIEYFLDVKLYDIPNTVAKASENIIERGASFFNIHSLGGYEMMRECVKASQKKYEQMLKNNSEIKPPKILAVTILTSIDDVVLKKELGIKSTVTEMVINLANLSKRAGVSGVVASSLEAKIIKERLGEEFIVLCPGIRPIWSETNDQKRYATCKYALENGADYIVLGRAVTMAKDKTEAIKLVYDEIMS